MQEDDLARVGIKVTIRSLIGYGNSDFVFKRDTKRGDNLGVYTGEELSEPANGVAGGGLFGHGCLDNFNSYLTAIIGPCGRGGN